MKAACLWSGGKDSCFACYKAKSCGHRITSLLNFVNLDGRNSISHGLSTQIIKKQALMTGISFLQKAMSKENYENDFKGLALKLKENEEIKGIIFGDIYLEEHKFWIDRVCKEIGLEPVMPLWGQDTDKLINELIERGFKAIIVSTRKELLGKEWLGRKIDTMLVNELKEIGNIDLCGEKGEFHTFVYDGPIFKKPVEFITGEKILKDNHWLLEIMPKERRQ